MNIEGEQLALFDLPEIPKATLRHSVYDAERLITNWMAHSNVNKGAARNAVALIIEELDKGVKPEDINYVFVHDTLLAKEKTITFESLQEALQSVENDKLARKLLHAWLNRSAVSGVSAHASIVAVRKCLSQGVAVEDIKYALAHRTLLASHKRLSERIIVKAVAGIEKDKKAGHRAVELFQEWYKKWYEERYTQPVGQITAALKKALLDDIDDQLLAEALDSIGRSQTPVTGPSIQYGLVQAEKARDRRRNAGANTSLKPSSEFSTVSSQKAVKEQVNNNDRWDSPW